MNNIAKHLAPSAAIVALALGLCCAKKPEVDPNTGMPIPTHSLFIGKWVGKDKKGDVYTFTFTRNTWESYVEKDGARLPHYKGTYTHDGSSITLRVAEVGDLKTMQWAKEKGNMPESVSGRLVGTILRIGTLSDADLVKR
jgi:hypothetical protein